MSPRTTALLSSLLISPLLALCVPEAAAVELAGKRHIYLLDKQGQAMEIGSVLINGDDGDYRYTIDLEMKLFHDHFLSMKEMKCLEGPELWCYVPYPYQTPRTISANNLKWLEHDLLFLFKSPETFGAKLWNGIYYPLRLDEDGVIRGEARALDLNMLASPPDDLQTPPVGDYDFGDYKLDTRWLPEIEIR